MRKRKFGADPVRSGANQEPESKTQSAIKTSEDEKPIVSASELRITPPRTPEQIRRLIAEGRFAEMTPGQAGIDDES